MTNYITRKLQNRIKLSNPVTDENYTLAGHSNKETIDCLKNAGLVYFHFCPNDFGETTQSDDNRISQHQCYPFDNRGLLVQASNSMRPWLINLNNKLCVDFRGAQFLRTSQTLTGNNISRLVVISIANNLGLSRGTTTIVGTPTQNDRQFGICTDGTNIRSSPNAIYLSQNQEYRNTDTVISVLIYDWLYPCNVFYQTSNLKIIGKHNITESTTQNIISGGGIKPNVFVSLGALDRTILQDFLYGQIFESIVLMGNIININTSAVVACVNHFSSKYGIPGTKFEITT